MKWEYKTIKLPPDSFFVEDKPSFEALEVDKLINRLGHEGWGTRFHGKHHRRKRFDYSFFDKNDRLIF